MSDKVEVDPISGFPEWLPNARIAEQAFIAIIQRQYELFGFSPIETPAVERVDVLLAKGGMQRQVFVLGKPEEDESKADLGLHFDLTVPLARYVVQHSAKLTFPFRRYQIQKVWRGERAQRSRYREFYQCDIDIVGRGSLDLIHDAEIPCVINAVFEALGITNFVIRVSHRRILGALLARWKLEEEQAARVLRAVDKTQRDGPDALQEAMSQSGVATDLALSINNLVRCGTLDEARRVLEAAGAACDGIDELAAVIASAKSLGLPAARVVTDFSIARGLDYYSGTVYETFIDGKEDWGSVCSGGRYDDLAGLFSHQAFPGVGISIGLTRLFTLLLDAGVIAATAHSPTRVLVTMQDRRAFLDRYLGIARGLRGHGVCTEVYLEPHALRDQIGYAAAKGIPLVVIAGESEFAAGCVAVKDLRNRTQDSVSAGDLFAYVQGKLSSIANG